MAALRFARHVVADINGLLSALDGVGLRLRADVPFDAALLARYFFRDAQRQAVAQQQSRERREHWRRKAAEAAKSVYAGDRVDVTLQGRVLRTRSTRKAEVVRVDGEAVRVRFTGGEERTVVRSAVRLSASRSAIDAWPDSFIFFDRVLGLLRGLTAALDVSQSYLDVMTPYARQVPRPCDRPVSVKAYYLVHGSLKLAAHLFPIEEA